MNETLTEKMRFRADILAGIRSFFADNGYSEADVPVMSPAVIPEAAIELFSSRQIMPWGKQRDLFLLPSPEYYLKQLIAAGSGDIYCISRSFRNSEQHGSWHSPEFSMLEWYTMNAGYLNSIEITERLFDRLLGSARIEVSGELSEALKPPFQRVTMDEIFEQYTGFNLSGHCTGRLSPEEELADLYSLARRLGLSPAPGCSWEELFNLVFVHQVEPRIPKNRPLVIYNYPAAIAALAKPAAAEGRLERWELYAGGIELANCYSEETDYGHIKAFFDGESEMKQNALVPAVPDHSWCEIFRNGFPRCSGTALGVDRLMMLLSGSRTLGGVILFPLPDIITDL